MEKFHKKQKMQLLKGNEVENVQIIGAEIDKKSKVKLVKDIKLLQHIMIYINAKTYTSVQPYFVEFLC